MSSSSVKAIVGRALRETGAALRTASGEQVRQEYTRSIFIICIVLLFS
jgi:hypothetical protein